jgi:hypothetical protein
MSITNDQWRVILAIAIPVLVLAATWGALKGAAEDIPAMKEAIDANENAIIKIEGKLETIEVQQRSYHEETAEHLE